MKIALVGPLDEPVSEHAPGGTEVWTASFARSLVERGHDVTVFATEESEVSGKLISICSSEELRGADGELSRPKFALYSLQEMVEIVKLQEEFDLIHLSTYSLHHYLPLVELVRKPVVITIHGSSFSGDEAQKIVERYSSPRYVFISQSFAKGWAKPKNSHIIYNGIDPKRFEFSLDDRGYFLWLGRVSKEKGTSEAIRLTGKAGVKLIMAGSIRNQEYFEKEVKPYLGPHVESVGQVDAHRKIRLYSEARALLMPINWEEPFGLVAVEAMASGTPVIAYNRGAMSEVIADQSTGILVEPNNENDFVQAIRKIQEMPEAQYQTMRQASRQRVENEFSLELMTENYEQLYRELV